MAGNLLRATLSGTHNAVAPRGRDRMRTQVWILAASFIVFGIIGWILLQQFSLAYVGLITFGVLCFIVGALAPK